MLNITDAKTGAINPLCGNDVSHLPRGTGGPFPFLCCHRPLKKSFIVHASNGGAPNSVDSSVSCSRQPTNFSVIAATLFTPDFIQFTHRKNHKKYRDCKSIPLTPCLSCERANQSRLILPDIDRSLQGNQLAKCAIITHWGCIYCIHGIVLSVSHDNSPRTPPDIPSAVSWKTNSPMPPLSTHRALR